MKYLIFAVVVGLGLATPSFAQQSGGNSMNKGAATSSMPSGGAMAPNSSHQAPMRHARHARAGAPASRAQNEAEQRETAQLNQQQLQQHSQ